MKGRADPTALAANSTPATCMARIRPKRSAREPANAAPTTHPSRAEATVKPSTASPTWNRSWMADTAPLMTALS